jgi:c-di-GMP-related signal transduction protein
MEVFLARQPIFNKHQEVVAYELLFRVGSENSYNHINGDEATLDVISSSFLLIGMDALTGGKRAFINFTGNLIKADVATILPKNLIVVEVLENVKFDDEILASCRKLKKLGYTLALDDFVYNRQFIELIKLADIIKVDFLQTKGEDRRAIIQNVYCPSVKFLAEKVETKEDFEEAVALGYSYFQGYFFSKPVIISVKQIPSNKLSYIKLLRDKFNKYAEKMGINPREVSELYI